MGDEELRVAAEQLRRLLGAVDEGTLVATAVERAHLAGALVAVEHLLGERGLTQNDHSL